MGCDLMENKKLNAFTSHLLDTHEANALFAVR